MQESPIPGFYEGEHEQYSLQKATSANFFEFRKCFIDQQGTLFFNVDISAGDGKIYVLPQAVLDAIYFDCGPQGAFYQRYMQENEYKVKPEQQQYIHMQWEKETEMFKRLSFAVERGWGMLMCYVSGG